MTFNQFENSIHNIMTNNNITTNNNIMTNNNITTNDNKNIILLIHNKKIIHEKNYTKTISKIYENIITKKYDNNNYPIFRYINCDKDKFYNYYKKYWLKLFKKNINNLDNEKNNKDIKNLKYLSTNI